MRVLDATIARSDIVPARPRIRWFRWVVPQVSLIDPKKEVTT
jgi:hypothetical protein